LAVKKPTVVTKPLKPITFFFCADITYENINELLKKLRDDHALYKIGIDFIIRITTDGGVIEPAMALVSFIHFMRRDGRRIVTHASGGTYSGGATILQAGTHRLMDKYAFLMTHEPRVELENWKGSSTDFEDYQQAMKQAGQTQVQFFSDRTGHQESYLRENLFTGRDTYHDAEAALELGLVDEIVDSLK
jgi:ATP-dependent protease ClpP protease subunit